jgi:hypothetical protein
MLKAPPALPLIIDAVLKLDPRADTERVEMVEAKQRKPTTDVRHLPDFEAKRKLSELPRAHALNKLAA